MRKRDGWARCVALFGLALILAAGRASAIELKVKTLEAGLSFDHLSRTVVWQGDEASSKILSSLVSARVEIGLAKGPVFSLAVGLSLSDFSTLDFDALPITLRYGGAPLSGLALAAELTAPLHKIGHFEISASGRIVSSRGTSRVWPLEGFAVEGEAEGRSSWMEVSAGPRCTYSSFGRVVPFIELDARWLRAAFRMSETLGELNGEDKKKVGGDLAFGITIGADAKVADRIAVRAKAGLVPSAGGVDGLASIGVLYEF